MVSFLDLVLGGIRIMLLIRAMGCQFESLEYMRSISNLIRQSPWQIPSLTDAIFMCEKSFWWCGLKQRWSLSSFCFCIVYRSHSKGAKKEHCASNKNITFQRKTFCATHRLKSSFQFVWLIESTLNAYWHLQSLKMVIPCDVFRLTSNKWEMRSWTLLCCSPQGWHMNFLLQALSFLWLTNSSLETKNRLHLAHTERSISISGLPKGGRVTTPSGPAPTGSSAGWGGRLTGGRGGESAPRIGTCSTCSELGARGTACTPFWLKAN